MCLQLSVLKEFLPSFCLPAEGEEHTELDDAIESVNMGESIFDPKKKQPASVQVRAAPLNQ